MEWRTWTKRAAWLCVAVYLYIGFIAYPARRSGGQWLFLDGAPGWVIGLAIVCFVGSLVMFSFEDRPRAGGTAARSTDGDDDTDRDRSR